MKREGASRRPNDGAGAVSGVRRFAVMLIAAILLGAARASAPQASTAQQASPAGSPAPHVVVVELFTSQGCSTCPPADRLLTLLGEESAGRVVPLSFHVDYWNHDGWTDPFSRKEWSERQAAYARAFRSQQVYTPQAVVDGGAELNGSDGNRLRAAIAAARVRPAAEISLDLEPANSKVMVRAEVDLPDALRGLKLDLMLAVFETNLVTAVGRGENGGRILQNDFVVRSFRRGARLAAGAGRTRHEVALPLDKDWKRSRLGVAAFLQDSRTLEIFGAASRLLSIREGS